MLETALSGTCQHNVLKLLVGFYTDDVLRDRGECVKFCGQKVKVQGHGGITYAGAVTVQAEAYSTCIGLLHTAAGFFQVRCPFCHPTNSIKALKEILNNVLNKW